MVATSTGRRSPLSATAQDGLWEKYTAAGVARQRLVYDILVDQFAAVLHALSVRAKTAAEETR